VEACDVLLGGKGSEVHQYLETMERLSAGSERALVLVVDAFKQRSVERVGATLCAIGGGCAGG
jgi:hypothetical protein